MAFVPVGYSKVGIVFAQSSNSLVQDGDGNEASQSKSSSQSTNQNSMCVSGESTSLSCNNPSSEDSKGIQRDTNSMDGMIYVIQGLSVTPVSRGEATSTAGCNAGDSIISGYFSVSEDGNGIKFREITENLHPENNEYGVHIRAAFQNDEYTLKSNAVCFNNPIEFWNRL